MLKKEKRYDFRKALLKLHQESTRDANKKPSEQDFLFENGCTIHTPPEGGAVLYNAVKDLSDYLFISQGVSAGLSANAAGTAVRFELTGGEITEPAKRMEFIMETGEGIKISACHPRGLAQGAYRLQQLMQENKAPFIKKGRIHSAPAFSPRMAHSAYGMDLFPDQYLIKLARDGFDAILVFVKGVDTSTAGYLDFNELCHRAAAYGIDVYMYSYLKSSVHPDDPAAKDYYDGQYGEVFKSCPAFAGVVLVGESVLFPSRDSATNGLIREPDDRSYIPTGKPSPGWWPCTDYPKLIECIKDSVKEHAPDAEIIFWTYNWGYAPREERIRLINSLPPDITLQVTFEMFEKYSMEHIDGYCADYTLSFAGPGKYFLSEAQAAKKRGLKLYTMCNTGGKTWDFGCIPYQPMPYQWLKRNDALLKAKKDFGLSGLMESHHYGVYPSFISRLAGLKYSSPDESGEALLTRVLNAQFGEENSAPLKKALKLWSEAITYYTPSNEDQYGAFRIGPAYPFCFIKKFMPKTLEHAHFGSRIVIPEYSFPYLDFSAPPAMRMDDEISFLTKMKKLMDEGVEILAGSPAVQNDELLRIVNLGKYISATVQTGINAKKWHILKTGIFSEKSAERVREFVQKAKDLLTAEIENSYAALPLAEVDSTLGYEPSMDYIGDPQNIQWKIRQAEYVRDTELDNYAKRLPE